MGGRFDTVTTPEPIVPAGTLVTYWGNAANNKYYGKTMLVMWANECGCKHQTYALQCIETGGQLSQAMRESFRVMFVEDEDNG